MHRHLVLGRARAEMNLVWLIPLCCRERESKERTKPRDKCILRNSCLRYSARARTREGGRTKKWKLSPKQFFVLLFSFSLFSTSSLSSGGGFFVSPPSLLGSIFQFSFEISYGGRCCCCCCHSMSFPVNRCCWMSWQSINLHLRISALSSELRAGGRGQKISVQWEKVGVDRREGERKTIRHNKHYFQRRYRDLVSLERRLLESEWR